MVSWSTLHTRLLLTILSLQFICGIHVILFYLLFSSTEFVRILLSISQVVAHILGKLLFRISVSLTVCRLYLILLDLKFIWPVNTLIIFVGKLSFELRILWLMLAFSLTEAKLISSLIFEYLYLFISIFMSLRPPPEI